MKKLLPLLICFLILFSISSASGQSAEPETVHQTEEYAILNMIYLGRVSYVLVQAGSEAPVKRTMPKEAKEIDWLPFLMAEMNRLNLKGYELFSQSAVLSSSGVGIITSGPIITFVFKKKK